MAGLRAGPLTLAGASLRPGARPDHDAWALDVIDRAWKATHHQAPSPVERLIAAAMARGESYYGMGYGAAKNWGSIHAKGSPPCGPGAIPWTDHRADGTPYETCMRAYATDEEGAADLIRQITTRRPRTWAAMRARRSIDEIAAELRAERYYEAPASQYAKMIRNNLAVILKNTNTPDPWASPAPPSPSSSPSSSAAPFVLLLLGGAAFLARR